MRKIIAGIILIAVCYNGSAQVKMYKGIITVLFNDYKGNVYLDLSGENKGLIRIDELSRGKMKNSLNVNAGLVSKIIIGKDTFYRQDLQDTYDNEGIRKINCYLKKICGKKDIGLFEWKDIQNQSHYYFKFPADNVAKNIDHPYYSEWTMSFYEGFKACDNLSKRFLIEYSKKEKYPLYNIITDAEKIVAWKKIIMEYDECKPAKE